MKKLLILSLTLALLLSSCGKSAGESRENTNNLNTVEEDPEIPEPLPEESASEEGIDVDLTDMSATMVYSEVFNMMMEPEKYMGKTIKMNGMYTVYFDEEAEKRYHACIISDATACCSQGIEFELTDDYSYPDDYPEEAADICVVGVFDTYKEGESTYCTLRKARLA